MTTQNESGFKISLSQLYRKEEEKFCKPEEAALSFLLLVLLSTI